MTVIRTRKDSPAFSVFPAGFGVSIGSAVGAEIEKKLGAGFYVVEALSTKYGRAKVGKLVGMKT